ncbi:MAG: dTDP-4-amino-4,6-dideoxygalactose transaminase [Cyclobacteriaceae bacterium]|jgi:dTDP-4-amino-4,6-dideoxygalactose transaminase
MNDKIWLSSPHMGGNEIKYVTDAFDTNWIAPLGPNVDNFELELGKFNNVNHVAALSSGTAAIHLALILSNVKRDDEVLCQSMTFSASANPIIYQGASPIFIDSERETWNMDPNLLREAIISKIRINKKPKAMIVVHLYGMPSQMDDIMSISKEFEIPVIEDAAEAIGSKFHGQYCGTFGDLGIYSFNGNKIITTSGGGALVSTNKEKIDKARFLATQARDSAPHYEHSEIGYNYKMSNISAGIGRGQLEVLKDRIQQRRANYDFYEKHLGDIEGLSFHKEPDEYFSNRWLTTLLIDPKITGGIGREDIRLSLLKENIEARPLWKPMHLQPIFRNSQQFLNGVSDELFRDGLCLPSGSNLTLAEKNKVVQSIKSVLKS